MRSLNSVKLSCDKAFGFFFLGLSKFYITTLIYRVMQWLLPIRMNATCPYHYESKWLSLNAICERKC